MEPPVQKPEPADPIISSDEKILALFAHLSLVIGLGIIVPLIIWLVKREESSFLDDQGKEALNFQLSVLLASLVLSVTCIGPLVVAIGGIVYAIIAAIESNKGVRYRYPYTFRMIT
jgi:uncharacterized Tic20 family protein